MMLCSKTISIRARIKDRDGAYFYRHVHTIEGSEQTGGIKEIISRFVTAFSFPHRGGDRFVVSTDGHCDFKIINSDHDLLKHIKACEAAGYRSVHLFIRVSDPKERKYIHIRDIYHERGFGDLFDDMLQKSAIGLEPEC